MKMNEEFINAFIEALKSDTHEIHMAMIGDGDMLVLEVKNKEQDIKFLMLQLFVHNGELFEKDSSMFLFFAEEWFKNRGCEAKVAPHPNMRWYHKIAVRFFVIRLLRKVYRLLGLKAFEREDEM